MQFKILLQKRKEQLRLLKTFVMFMDMISTCSTKLVQAFSIWKFWCKRCTSLWSTNHWKIRWNHGKSWTRPVH